ncbi:hypothetical protein R3P38DRAFT_3267586 [Favolaschia claudopus]|uniref:Uncharacterized protein n=1 Tax=Favolaschia claudopus TaxID=2862362 RepID=A0AAW0BRR0_9AGAR
MPPRWGASESQERGGQDKHRNDRSRGREWAKGARRREIGEDENNEEDEGPPCVCGLSRSSFYPPTRSSSPPTSLASIYTPSSPPASALLNDTCIVITKLAAGGGEGSEKEVGDEGGGGGRDDEAGSEKGIEKQSASASRRGELAPASRRDGGERGNTVRPPRHLPISLGRPPSRLRPSFRPSLSFLHAHKTSPPASSSLLHPRLPFRPLLPDRSFPPPNLHPTRTAPPSSVRVRVQVTPLTCFAADPSSSPPILPIHIHIHIDLHTLTLPLHATSPPTDRHPRAMTTSTCAQRVPRP